MPVRRERKGLKAQVFHILLALADRDLHGLEIMEDVRERTEGDVHLWPGALYGSLKQMTEDALIQETDPPDGADRNGGRPRYYRITPEGKSALSMEVARLSSYVAAALAKSL